MVNKRVILVILDSAGVGYAPDAATYGDEGSNTIGNIAKAIGGLNLPNLSELGLGNIGDFLGVPKNLNARGCYGVMQEISCGKDTTSGHWEIAGTPILKPLPTYPNAFPDDLIKNFVQAIGRNILGNEVASGTEIISRLGAKHMATGFPIVYTSADSVFQIACHEQIIPLYDLYDMCNKARAMLTGKHGVGRVIARPFVGEVGNFTRTANRRDFSLLPPDGHILMQVKAAGLAGVSVGKIHDIFAESGVTASYISHDNNEGVAQTIKAMTEHGAGLIWTNLVDFDMLYGHRNDVDGYAKALVEFDEKLPQIMTQMADDDILMITADHGNDPTTPSTDHSRERVPLLVWGKKLKAGVDLGVRQTFADVGATIADYLNTEKVPAGVSFLSEII